MSSDQRTNYKLVPARTFLKDLEKQDNVTNQRITRSIEELPQDPFMGKSLRGDLEGLYSLRVGDYRVIYSIEIKNRRINLHAARHRSKVYEK